VLEGRKNVYELRVRDEVVTVDFGRELVVSFDLTALELSGSVLLGHVFLKVVDASGVDVTPAIFSSLIATEVEVWPGDPVSLQGYLGDGSARFALRRGQYKVSGSLSVMGTAAPPGSGTTVISEPVVLIVQ